MISTPIRVLVVDDSALVRKAVTESLAPFSDIQVVATAVDPYVARTKILELAPDVITLDIEMPRMDGLTFLKLLMQHRPMPVIVMSSLTQSGSRKACEVLEAGAVDVVPKPESTSTVAELGPMLAQKIRAAASCRLAQRSDRPGPIAPRPKPTPATARRSFPSRQVILLGASTGGTEAIREVLMSIRGDLPGICVVQHIPARFSNAFACRLNQLCAMEVREARDGDALQPGTALIAPGGFHLLLHWQATHYVVELGVGPAVHHQRPAVDILFESALRAGAAPHAIAAVLTGMGGDGAAGLLKLRQAGARTIAQDEQSSVVFGMPREAIRVGAAEFVAPLNSIGTKIEQLVAAPFPPSARAARCATAPLT